RSYIMTVSEENKTIARYILQALGGQPSISKYWDDNKENNVDLLSTINRPFVGITSYSTIGLSNHPSGGDIVGEKSLRVEIIGAHATENRYFPNILATCAFNIINSKKSVSPGEVFQDIVALYYPDSEMRHILFTDPFLWE